MNRLVGRAVSITAPKPQTTRNRILGIVHGPAHQAVFMDTPGIHQALDPLNTRMVKYAHTALQEADLILLLVEPHPSSPGGPPAQVTPVLELIRQAKGPALLVINKIDKAAEGEVLESIGWYDGTGLFTEIFPVSALKGRGVDRLAERIPAYLPEGPQYFEPELFTDQSERQIIAELIRQEVFRRVHQEVPYSTAVRVEHMRDTENLVSIYAKIFVEWDSQKGILIGKKGRMLKGIGQAARHKIEALLGTRVYLDLRVSVLKDWSEDPRRLTDLGYPEA